MGAGGMQGRSRGHNRNRERGQVSEGIDVCIVGGGLAGLACARRLAHAHLRTVLLEASDEVGGRVRTDLVDGFLLDRGFQVLQTAYPEARRVFDYPRLDLRPFQPGALVRIGGRFWRVSDPTRRPREAIASMRAPVGSPADKLKVALLLRRVRSVPPQELLRRPETSTYEALHLAGFSERMIERFWRPLFAGIQLDPGLATSSRMFEFVFRMLADGDASVPATGIGALPAQLAAALPQGSIRTGARITRVEPGRVTEEGGAEPVTARAVVVATEAPEAARLVGVPEIGSRSVSCLYFSADEAPLPDPALILNGEGRGPINQLAVMSNAAPSYAPEGSALISVSVLKAPGAGREQAVRDQLQTWFGPGTRRWRHLATYDIPHAQPDQRPPWSAERPVRLAEGLYLAGDHRNTSSIQGALLSGRRAAEAILADLA